MMWPPTEAGAFAQVLLRGDAQGTAPANPFRTPSKRAAIPWTNRRPILSSRASRLILIWADPGAVAVLVAAAVVIAVVSGTGRRCADGSSAVGRPSVDPSARRCARYRVVASCVHGPATVVGSTAVPNAAAPATTGECVIGNKASADKDGCGENSQSRSKHGHPPHGWRAFRWLAVMPRQRPSTEKQHFAHSLHPRLIQINGASLYVLPLDPIRVQRAGKANSFRLRARAHRHDQRQALDLDQTADGSGRLC